MMNEEQSPSGQNEEFILENSSFSILEFLNILIYAI